MKKLLLIGLLTICMQNTLANSKCSIIYNTANEKLQDAINDMPNFDFENYSEVCKILKNANAKVTLSSISGISNDQTTAVVISNVRDKNLPIFSDISHNSMVWDEKRTTQTEKQLIMYAVNNALNAITKEHIDSLNENRKKLGYESK